MRRPATDFTIHVESGGVTGVIATLIGKQPADYHFWIMAGVPPASLGRKSRCTRVGHLEDRAD